MSSQLVLVLNLQDTKLFLEPEDNAYNPSIQRSSFSPSSLFFLSRLQESYLKDWLCSFPLVVVQLLRTALNCWYNYPPPRWWLAEKPPTCISINFASAHCQSMQLLDLLTSCPSCISVPPHTDE